MALGDRIGFDFNKLDLEILTADAMTPQYREVMKKVMSETLSHLDVISTLSNPDVKCHVDSYFRPVSQKEAAIRASRGGREYCTVPSPMSGQRALRLRTVRALALTGALMGFIEMELRSRGIDCAVEARTDFNRFHSLAALYPDGRIGLFVDVGGIYPRYRNDEELARILMFGADDLAAASVWASLFHLAMHAVQMDRFYKNHGLEDPYDGMKARFLAGCSDPAYYMASYPENLMCLEAEVEAVLSTAEFIKRACRGAPAENAVLDYLNYKIMWHNTENLIFPGRDGGLPDYDYALTSLLTKMFKTAEWYRTEPDHDRFLPADIQKEIGWDRPGGKQD